MYSLWHSLILYLIYIKTGLYYQTLLLCYQTFIPSKIYWHKLTPNIFIVHMTLQYYFELSSLFSIAQCV